MASVIISILNKNLRFLYKSLFELKRNSASQVKKIKAAALSRFTVPASRVAPSHSFYIVPVSVTYIVFRSIHFLFNLKYLTIIQRYFAFDSFVRVVNFFTHTTISCPYRYCITFLFLPFDKDADICDSSIKGFSFPLARTVQDLFLRSSITP